MYVINTIQFKYLDLIDLQINHFNYSILMSYPVKNSDIEGQHILYQVTPVQLSKIRLLLAVIIK